MSGVCSVSRQFRVSEIGFGLRGLKKYEFCLTCKPKLANDVADLVV